MACYHFTIKVDQKPDKSPISASTHADYINREGSFTNIDFRRELDSQKLSGCILRPCNHQLRRHKRQREKYLYQSIYGSIKEINQGIEFTKDASLETRQIALALACTRYGDELCVSGSAKEISRLLLAGRDMDYPVKFTNKAINHSYQQLLEENHHDKKTGFSDLLESSHKQPSNTRDGINNGQHDGNGNIPGTRVEPARGQDHTNLHLPDLKPTPHKRPPAQRTPLRTLLQRHLDAHIRNSRVLLPSHDASSLEQSGSQRPNTMRWDFRRGARRKADDIAKRIWAQLDGITPASHHADYINRRNNFAPKSGCIYRHAHLPKWSHNDPKEFFKAADEHERANGTRYREIEFALPNELSTNQQKEIIDTFIEHHLQNHYYAYAIHDKIGAMGNGQHNTHVHIMFSEREIDDVEKTAERSSELFFRRANPKHPERGGAPKASKWNDKHRARYLCELRRDYAEIQNAVLRKYKIDATVDHRSLKDQYLEALKNGNQTAALLLDRLPEEHLGPAITSDKNNPKVVNLMAYRAYKFQRSQLVRMITQLEQEHASELAADSMQKAQQSLLDQEVHEAELKESPALAKLKDTVISDYRSLIALQEIIITKAEARQLAMEKLLPPADLNILTTYKQLSQENDELKKLRQDILTSSESEIADKMTTTLTDDILMLSNRLESLQPRVAAINASLEEEPIKQQLMTITQQILKDDKPQKWQLWQLTQKLNQDTSLLHDEMEKAIIHHLGAFLSGKDDEDFSTRDLNCYLQGEVRGLTKALQRKNDQLAQLKKRLVTPERAAYIAQSVYLKGEPKRLRIEMRTATKEASRLEIARHEYQAAQANFSTLPKPKWYQSSKNYNAEAQRIRDMHDSLEERAKELALLQVSLTKKQALLAQKCSTPEAQEKISRITAKVLLKDRPNKERVAKMEKVIQKMQNRLSDVSLMQAAVKAELTLERPLHIHKKKAGGAHARQQMENFAHSLISHRIPRGGLSASLQKNDHRDFEAMDETEKEAQAERSL